MIKKILRYTTNNLYSKRSTPLLFVSSSGNFYLDFNVYLASPCLLGNLGKPVKMLSPLFLEEQNSNNTTKPCCKTTHYIQIKP